MAEGRGVAEDVGLGGIVAVGRGVARHLGRDDAVLDGRGVVEGAGRGVAVAARCVLATGARVGLAVAGRCTGTAGALYVRPAVGDGPGRGDDAGLGGTVPVGCVPCWGGAEVCVQDKMNRRARVVSSPAIVTPVSAVAGVARQYCGTLGKVANCQLGVFLPMPRPAATLVGGALLRWGIVQAGQASARDRDGQLEAMKPTFRAPSWDPSRRR